MMAFTDEQIAELDALLERSAINFDTVGLTNVGALNRFHARINKEWPSISAELQRLRKIEGSANEFRVAIDDADLALPALYQQYYAYLCATLDAQETPS